MMIATPAATERAVVVSEPEAEVLLTASVPNLKDETIVTTVADAMSAIGTMTATTTMIVRTVISAATGRGMIDALTMDIGFMRSTITLLSPVLRVMDRLSFSVGRRLSRGEITSPSMSRAERLLVVWNW
jgi:hypothetical protein